MNCHRIPRHTADDLARRAGLDPEDPRYRNATVLCQRAQQQQPPYEDNLTLAWQFEQLQRVRRDLVDLGLAPEYFLYQAGTESHAAKVIAEFPELITSGDQLRGVSNLGPKTRARVDEWLETGRIARLDELEQQLFHASGKYTEDYLPPPVRVPELHGNR